MAKCLSRKAGTPAQLLLVEIGTLNQEVSDVLRDNFISGPFRHSQHPGAAYTLNARLGINQIGIINLRSAGGVRHNQHDAGNKWFLYHAYSAPGRILVDWPVIICLYL
uniref:hypothetical protein n=1 Tax=Escherichia coli TaxID=562 RepID=UPI00350E4955